MLRSGRVTADDPAVVKGLAYLERFVGPRGGLSEAPHSVYSTSVALMAFQAANKGGRFDRIIKGGQDFLKMTQWDEGEGKGRGDAQYGGLGYGGDNSRPDLSNTAFFMESLRDTGLPADDPALKRHLYSCRGARISRVSSTTSRAREKSTTAGSSIRPISGTPTQRQDGQGGRRQGKGPEATAASFVCRDDLCGLEEHDLRGTDAG